jgi:hypothetical protein
LQLLRNTSPLFGDNSGAFVYDFARMTLLRALIFDHRKLAMLLVAAALAVKALVPAGYMVSRGPLILTVSICAESLGTQQTRQLVIPMKDGQVPSSKHDKRDGACAYSALGFGSLAAIDPILLAFALAFVLALGFVANAPMRRTLASRLRPPLRGPPLTA